MGRLAGMALDALGSGDAEDVEEGIGLARSFLELSLGRMTGLYREEVLDEPASPEELAEMRRRLIGLARGRVPVRVAQAALHALGRLFDPELTGVFVEVLRDHRDADAGALYQAMIALDNLGLDVFAGREVRSIREEAENRRLAAEFLARIETAGSA
jgi:hypothetical protein